MLNLDIFLIKMLRECVVRVILTPTVFIPLDSNLFIHWTCAPPILCTFDKYFLILGLLNLDIVFNRNAKGCLVCVIGNSSNFHSFIFNIGIIIVHTLKMCTSYFVHI